ncbi:OmpH family outer membrane protein [uncultured Sphingomonas sp.]|uniref:OmpH family outer membrane protein n=1 Tax=uncultured Sphingomonas sp. TaxID=158754 RepID=UPI0035CC35B8
MTFKHILLAVVSPAVLVANAAQAQAVAVADPQAAMENTKAFQAAAATIRTTYASAITQLQTRQAAIQAELQPQVTKFQADQRANVPQATLQAEATAIQTRENAARAELGGISAPIQRAQAYALEQIQPKLADAVTAAMKARGVTLLLKPDGAYVIQPASDLTPAITTQLDAVVPSVNATPPAGYVPGQAAGAPGAAPAAAPTRRQPSGR